MTSPGKVAAVYAVTSAKETGALAVEKVAEAAVGSQYSSLTPTMVAGQPYLLGYNPAQDHFDVYQFPARRALADAGRRQACDWGRQGHRQRVHPRQPAVCDRLHRRKRRL